MMYFVVVVLMMMSSDVFVPLSETSMETLQLWFAFTQHSVRGAAKNQLRLHFILHHFSIISSEASCRLVRFIEDTERSFSQSTINE